MWAPCRSSGTSSIVSDRAMRAATSAYTHGQTHAVKHRADRGRRRLFVDVGHRDEPVSVARKRFDEPRVIGLVAKRGTQPLHGGVETVFEIDEGAVRP